MISVQLEAGEVVIVKPNAKIRNNSLIEASEGRDKPNQLLFTVKCLPFCIKSHPWGTIKISQALDSLDYEEWDKLAKALGEVMKPLSSEDQKK